MLQGLNIIFSIILLPVNIRCAFWLFREAMDLTGMTFREFLTYTSDMNFAGADGYRGMKKRQRFLAAFFQEKSADPQKSIRLLRTFGICTLPGAAALPLAVYCARDPQHLKSVLIGNLLLVGCNLCIAAWGKVYRRSHPLPRAIREQLREKRRREKAESEKRRVQNIIVYSLVGAFFGVFLLFFMLLIGGMGISRIGTGGIVGSFSENSADISYEDVAAVLQEKGYETTDIPTTYCELDEYKLKYVCAGVKDGSKFEFYDYRDSETIDLIYNDITAEFARDMEFEERAAHETELPDGGRMFTIVIDGVYYVVLYQKDALVYAYSPDSLTKINDILFELGYFREE